MMGNFYRFENGFGYDHMSGWGSPFGMGLLGLIFAPIALLLLVWTVYWKYRALWHAAKNDEKWWFVALLVINTLGILEILYLYYFSKKALKHNEHNVPMVPPQS